MKGIISLYLGLTLLIAVIAALLFGSIGTVEGDVSAASTILSILSTICVGILSYAQGALHNEKKGIVRKMLFSGFLKITIMSWYMQRISCCGSLNSLTAPRK